MIAAAAAVFATVLLLTAVYLPLGRRLQHWDHPNARSAHEQPTLSSGGIAVIGGLLLGLGVAVLAGWVLLAPREQYALGLVALLCLIGVVDDYRSLPVALRLVLFLVISAVLVGLYFPAAPLPMLALAALALAWLLNLYNFMDGIDGLAALQCSLVAGMLALLAWIADAPPALVTSAAAVAAAYAAFLCFNWPPARVFMGDAGSLSAGLLLGWLGLWGVVESAVDAWCWLLLMSPFLLDTGVTLCLRAGRGERLTEAHNQHVYQRFARHSGSHRAVDLGLLMLQLLWLAPLAILASFQFIPSPIAFFLGLIPQLVLIAKASRLK